VVVVVALVCLLAVISYRLLDSRKLLAGRITAAMGREVTIGAASLRPGLRPGLEVRDVVVAESTGSSVLRAARFDRLDLVFALWPLVWGEFRLIQIEVEGGRLALQPADAPPEAQEAASGGGWQLSVRKAVARNVEIAVHRGDAVYTTTLERLTWGMELERQIHEATIKGSFGAIGFDLSGQFDHRSEAIEGTGRVPVTLSGTLAGAEVSGSGAIEGALLSPAIELRLQAKAPSLRDFDRAAGRELPALGPVRGAGLLRLRDGVLGLTELDLVLGSRDEAWLEVTGHVGDLAKRLEYSLASHFGFHDVRVLPEALKKDVHKPVHVAPFPGRHQLGGHILYDIEILEGLGEERVLHTLIHPRQKPEVFFKGFQKERLFLVFSGILKIVHVDTVSGIKTQSDEFGHCQCHGA